MDWDDEYDNGFDDMGHGSYRDNSMSDKGSSDGRLDFADIANPVSAYLFLSDDVQDEISGGKKKSMKCGSCGHRFAGEFYESCPKCYSINTDEVVAGIDDKEANLKCLDCGHTFVGETYESCPECYGFNTEEAVDEKDDEYL